MIIHLERFRKLPPAQRALVAVAVLLDGREASTYVEQDAHSGPELAEIARMIAELPNDVRVPLLGTELRDAITNLSELVPGER
jgi:hypothetical protein